MKTLLPPSVKRPPWRLALALLGLALLGQGSAQSAALSSTACSTSGNASTCNLYAKAGTMTLPGSTVPVWGYTDSASGVVSQPGGPVLIVNQGNLVTVNLTNNLPEATTLLFQGQSNVAPSSIDAGAAASSGTQTYTFSATNPGTYLYEASPLAGKRQHQTAMGLYGLLIVRSSTPGQAYNDLTGLAGSGAATLYDDEAAVVLSEIDPVLNASPSTFDIRNYAPQYFLINGKYYPNIDAIQALSGHKVLLHYVNAGVQQHSMGLLGLRENFVAKDGSPLPKFAHSVVAESIAPGESADAIVTLPVGVPDGTRYPLYDARFMMHNGPTSSKIPDIGGMLTFLTTGSTTTAYPTTSNVSLTPNPTNGTVNITVSATFVSDPGSQTASIDDAEFFIDAPGTNGNGTHFTGSGTITAPIAPGNHTIYIHGHQTDPTVTANTKWGTFATAVLQVAAAGPTTGAISLTPNPADGTVNVALSAPITSPLTGITVANAEFFIDAAGANGSGCSKLPLGGGSSATYNATIVVNSNVANDPCDLAGLAGGDHTIYVHAQAAGISTAWGAFSTATLTVNQNGPVTSAPVLNPTPTNGSVVVNIAASVTNGPAQSAEYFIDNTAPDLALRGYAVTVAGNNLSASIPAITVGTLSEDAHTISVRSKNATGNWGAVATSTLTIDKTGPAASASLVNAPAPASPGFYNATAPIVVNATFSDTTSAITRAEYFIDTFGAAGTGTAITLANPASATRNGTASILVATLNALIPGNHTLIVRGQDAVGNWGPTVSTPFAIDKVVPIVGPITPNPATILLGATTTLNLNANGTGTAIVGGEYWFDGTTTPPANRIAFTGTGAALLANTGALAGNGIHTIRVRVFDSAGNVSAVSSVPLYLVNAVANTLTITASGTAGTQQTNVTAASANGLLTNDLPIGLAGRTVTLEGVPNIIAGTPTAPATVTCQGGAGNVAAVPAIAGNTVCTNGAYRFNLTGVGNTNALRAASKRGTYQFTYTETLNGVLSTTTVTVTVR